MNNKLIFVCAFLISFFKVANLILERIDVLQPLGLCKSEQATFVLLHVYFCFSNKFDPVIAVVVQDGTSVMFLSDLCFVSDISCCVLFCQTLAISMLLRYSHHQIFFFIRTYNGLII